MKDQRPCLVQRVMEHFRDATSVGRVSQRVWDLAYTDCPRHTHRHINVPPILTMGARSRHQLPSSGGTVAQWLRHGLGG